MRKPRTIKDYGGRALLLEWEQVIAPEVNQGVHAYAAWISRWPEVLECVSAYASLLVKLRAEGLKDGIRERIYDEAILEVPADNERELCLPVVYGKDYGPDLAAIAKALRLPERSIIDLHLKRSYRVYQLGFQPGFAFLGNLDERLSLPRRRVPRARVPAGSVAIAGRQTAVYPNASPGGWHLLGRCPVPLVNYEASRPEELNVLQAGDKVRFLAITAAEFDELKQQPQLWWKQFN